MRIESIRIDGFGRLADRTLALPKDRAALIIADNEHGKSTLAMAIMAGICGIPKRRRSGEDAKLLDVFKPWECADYSLSLDIETGGRKLSVERDFARDKFAVRETATNRDVSSEFDQDIAASVLKLPRDDFRRIALILGKEVHRFDSSVTLRSRLTELVEGSKDTSAEAAIASIGAARYTLDDKSIKIETAVGRLSNALEKAGLEMARLNAQIDVASDETRELDDLQRRQAELSVTLSRLDGDYRRACLAETREQLRSAREGAEAVDALRAELEQLAPYATFPSERANQLTSALTRRIGLESRTSEVKRLKDVGEDEAVRLQTVIDQNANFASATEQDIVGLGGCAQEMENAARSVGEIRREFDAARRAGPAPVWTAVAAVGGLGALVCAGLMILKVISLETSLIWAAPCGLLGALALTFIARGGKQNSELKAKLEQAQDFHDSCVTRATRLLGVLGARCDSSEDAIEVARRTQDALTKFLHDHKRLTDVRADIASWDREAEDIRRKIGDEDAAIRAILDKAGIDPALPLDEARRRFEEAAGRWNRYREIKESLLPALEARLVSEDEIARLAERESSLALDGGEEQTAPARASAEVESDRQAARRELDAVAARLAELERKVGTLVENYRRQYPTLREQAENATAELARAGRFGAALGIAEKTLQEVAESTRRRWASALNDRAAAILPHLNPDYDSLLFDDRLDFTVRRVADSRVIDKTTVDSSLSTGAKDQVYLAVRLACAAELSSKEPIPIILDDAFIAFDDQRFEAALRYIAETVALGQQVILLSCHRSRHDRIRAEQWFRDRVEVIEL